ncbi:MAG: elongation factor G [Ruminococcaceae bacterium]|nr:elongation factor G [Oscillospiraceae bacterium]MBQ9913767.1 elongation factor G [Clostridia bacterium]
MKSYSVNNIRNIAIAGHTGKGKTALSEAMFYVAGITDRLGRVADGNTIMDYDAEEKKRKCSISSATASFEWRDTKINVLDAPGKFDFAGGMAEAMRAADCAVIVTSAGSGIDVGLEKAIKAADQRNIAKFFAITKVDSENRDFYKTFEALKAELGNKLCPVVVPYMNGPVCEAFVNLCSNKAFKYPNGRPVEIEIPSDDNIIAMRAALEEAVATVDEELMEKFFEGEPLTKEEIIRGLTEGVESGEIWPVYACSATKVDGCDMLMDAIVYSAPSPDKAKPETATDGNGEPIEVKADPAGPLAALCFKTVADPFVGKMSFVKVLSGKITPDTPAYNARTGESQKMGKLVTVKGIKQEETNEIPCGDIGVITKLSGLATGDTLCSAKNIINLEGVDFPAASLSMAVVVKKKGEEDKVASGLRKIIAEDPTITFESNEETKEMVVSGLGEQHLDIVVSKLKTKYGVEIDLKIPKVAYRETIRKSCQVQGRHKKQSGGSGQFGDVWVRFEPHDGDELIFETEVVGGSVPKNFFPAVEKGFQEAILKGPLAGYPVVGLKAVLYDGSYHPVDSNEMAFKTAAKIAYKNGMAQASPVILEPIGELKVYMPDANLGDIMGDITKRRGRVLGMGAADEPKMQELVAEVPMAEMGDFSTTLRSVTAGRGYFTLNFARYEDAPVPVAQKVIEEAKKDMEE